MGLVNDGLDLLDETTETAEESNEELVVDDFIVDDEDDGEPTDAELDELVSEEDDDAVAQKQREGRIAVKEALLAGDVPDMAEQIARLEIAKFFKDREYPWGGKIAENVLFSPAYLQLVLSMDICKGVDRLYEILSSGDDRACHVQNKCNGCVRRRRCPDSDIKLLLEVHRECKRMEIPEQFVGGITIMYVELCLGITMTEASLGWGET